MRSSGRSCAPIDADVLSFLEHLFKPVLSQYFLENISFIAIIIDHFLYLTSKFLVIKYFFCSTVRETETGSGVLTTSLEAILILFLKFTAAEVMGNCFSLVSRPLHNITFPFGGCHVGETPRTKSDPTHITDLLTPQFQLIS